MSIKSGVAIFLLLITLLFTALYMGVLKLNQLVAAGEHLLVRSESPFCDAVVVKYSDAWVYGPHALSIYQENRGKLKLIQHSRICNDGVIPDEKNYEAVWEECSLRLILKGEEQSDDTLIIPCD